MNNNILKITFDAATINGIIAKDITYEPSMSNPQLYSGFSIFTFYSFYKINPKFI